MLIKVDFVLEFKFKQTFFVSPTFGLKTGINH